MTAGWEHQQERESMMNLKAEYERQADELTRTKEYQHASYAEKYKMLQDLADSLHNQDYCVDDASLRKAAYQASQTREP